MLPVAQFEIRENILPSMGISGNFGGNGTCFSYVTTSKRVLVFDTSFNSLDDSKSYINAGQKINCLDTIRIREHEYVVIGTDNSLLVFDVMQNSQLFSVLVDDGVFSIAVIDGVIYTGSNCALFGYDISGDEVFWTVTGDVVTAMCGCVLNKNNSILVATNDLKISVFVGEESKREMEISSKCLMIRECGVDKFVAAFESGVVTFYDNLQRVWSYSTQNSIIGIQYTGFSVKEKDVVVGLASGEVLFLDDSSGLPNKTEIIGVNLSHVGLSNFKGDGKLHLVVTSTTGSIRVFSPKVIEGLGEAAKKAFELREAQPKLIKKKSRLLMKIYELESENNDHVTVNGQPVGPPKGMSCHYALERNVTEQCIELQISTNPPTPIQASVVDVPRLSNAEFCVFDVNNPALATQKILLWLPEDVVGRMRIECFISGVVFPFEIVFQKFYAYAQVHDCKPIGFLEFTIPFEDFGIFISKNFVVTEELGKNFRVCFQSVISKEKIALSSDGSLCKVECDKVSTAAMIVNELCDNLKLNEFSCRSCFPKEIEYLLAAIKDGSDLDETKNTHRAEVAGLIAIAKDIIVRIENAEAIDDYDTILSSVIECERINNQLFIEHSKRLTNKVALGTGSQKINALIQSFAELRKGNSRSIMLQLCRKELQSKRYKKLAHILEYGTDNHSHS